MKITMNARMINEKIFEISEITDGSEKQNSWANKIKLDKIGDLVGMAGQPGSSALLQYVEILNAQNNAKFWIDNRDNNFKTIIKGLIAK